MGWKYLNASLPRTLLVDADNEEEEGDDEHVVTQLLKHMLPIKLWIARIRLEQLRPQSCL